MKKNKFFILFYGLVTLLSVAPLLRAQTPQGFSGKRIEFPYHDPKTLKLKAIFTGQNAKQVSGSQVRVSEFGMRTFRNGNPSEVELIATAPDCLIDRNSSVASSSGKIQAYTATTNLYIEGEGFFCQQTNAILIISNKVQTIIRKDLLKSKSADKTSSTTNAFSSPGTNQLLKIFADHFQFLYELNLITYSGNVLVDDAQMELTCNTLTIELGTNKSIQQITADQNVVIVNKKDKSRAMGDQAVYVVNSEKELLELTGNPLWTDGQREGTAMVFKFDRKQNIFRAEKNAIFTMPREKLTRPGLFLGSSKTNAAAGPIVEIAADLISFKLPQTNGPIREIVAETNVVITSASDQSRASAAKAIYNAASGAIELTGNPVWKIQQNEISAEILVIGTNQFFAARTNVHLKLPSTLFGKTLGAHGTNTIPANTNQFVEIFADDFYYATNLATFRENVHGKMLDATLAQTSLDCGYLQILFSPSNQVQNVTARKSVFLQQIPALAAPSKILKKTVACEALTLNRSVETGFLKSIHATTNVVGEQIEQLASGEGLKRISAQDVSINFLPATNQIGSIVANEKVLAEKIEHAHGKVKFSQAQGELALYDSFAESLELTGKPTARIDNLFFNEATIFRWNLKTGKISANPYRVTTLSSTNNLKSILKNLQP